MTAPKLQIIKHQGEWVGSDNPQTHSDVRPASETPGDLERREREMHEARMREAEQDIVRKAQEMGRIARRK